jgi:hypothetical protein
MIQEEKTLLQKAYKDEAMKECYFSPKINKKSKKRNRKWENFLQD